MKLSEDAALVLVKKDEACSCGDLLEEGSKRSPTMKRVTVTVAVAVAVIVTCKELSLPDSSAN